MDDLKTMLEPVLESPWTIVASIVLGAFLLARVIVRLLRPILIHAASKTSVTWDDNLVKAISGPLSALFAVQGMRIALPWAPLTSKATSTIGDVVALLTTVALMWIVFRAIDIVRMVLGAQPWARERPASRSLLAIGARFVKVVVVVLGGITGLAAIGVSVGGLIAGLGIGGLALALAAQKTVENLFGTVSIGVDQPMREGDFVKVYDFVGTVEQIGLRSTRIRTLDRTVITVPNGELANQRIETFAVRDRIRMSCVLGLVYGTTADQLRGVLADLEQLLRAQPKIWPDTVVVKFTQLAASSLDIEVVAWFQTSDWGEFQAIRQDLLIAFMEAVERRGTSFAFPTQTVHVAGERDAPRTAA